MTELLYNIKQKLRKITNADNLSGYSIEYNWVTIFGHLQTGLLIYPLPSNTLYYHPNCMATYTIYRFIFFVSLNIIYNKKILHSRF